MASVLTGGGGLFDVAAQPAAAAGVSSEPSGRGSVGAPMTAIGDAAGHAGGHAPDMPAAGAPGSSSAVAPFAPEETGQARFASPEGLDPKVHRLVREQVRMQDEICDTMEELVPKLDVIEEKLLGGKRKDRRGRRSEQQGVSPLEMLACLQTVVDEHRMMESESLSKDDELNKMRKELTEAIERQSQLIEEKHEFLKQQNQLLLGQQADQKTLVELQHVRETHTRTMAELNAQLAAALSKAEGMSTVDTEMSRLRIEHGAAVASLNDQLMSKDAEIGEVMALLAGAVSLSLSLSLSFLPR
eukprot:COSAG01_NODE_1131_length_11572_cov_84.273337_3_plen_300_part_00